MAWLRSDLMALREERPTFTMFFEEHRAKTPLSEKGKQHVEKVVEYLFIYSLVTSSS